MADNDGLVDGSDTPGHQFDRGDSNDESISKKEINFKDVMNAFSEIKERKSNEPTDRFSSQSDSVSQYFDQMDSKGVLNTSEEVNQSISNLAANRKTEGKLNVVIAEYEKAIAQLVRTNAVVVKERDTVQKHLANAEAAFSDVHQKYERCKDIIEGFKNNETILKESIRKNEEEILRLNNKYEALKTHAMGQLEKANNELLEYRKNYSDEIIRLKATIQKLELKNSSLKQSVDQRNKECEELTRICDDLITKVGR